MDLIYYQNDVGLLLWILFNTNSRLFLTHDQYFISCYRGQLLLNANTHGDQIIRKLGSYYLH